MPDVPDECWSRVKKRLHAELGEAIYTSWFARMELESLDLETARISVPTRFLKSWIQSHYSERLLACWQAERSTVRRIDLSVRSAAIKIPAPPATADTTPVEKRDAGHCKTDIKALASPIGAILDSHGGSPLDPRARWLHLPAIDATPREWTWVRAHLLLGAARIRMTRVQSALAWVFVTTGLFLGWTMLIILTH